MSSSTTYVSQVSLTSDCCRGNWSILIQSRGTYSIQIQGISNVIISRDLYQIDSSSVYGFSSIDGKPLQGNEYNFKNLFLYLDSK